MDSKCSKNNIYEEKFIWVLIVYKLYLRSRRRRNGRRAEHTTIDWKCNRRNEVVGDLSHVIRVHWRLFFYCFVTNREHFLVTCDSYDDAKHDRRLEENPWDLGGCYPVPCLPKSLAPVFSLIVWNKDLVEADYCEPMDVFFTSFYCIRTRHIGWSGTLYIQIIMCFLSIICSL